MRTISLSLFAVLALGCGGGPATPATTAPATEPSANPAPEQVDGQRIVLHRPHQAGERYVATYRAESRTRELLTVDGQASRDETERLSIELVAEVLIQEVNARGKVTSRQLTVRSRAAARHPRRSSRPARCSS